MLLTVMNALNLYVMGYIGKTLGESPDNHTLHPGNCTRTTLMQRKSYLSALVLILCIVPSDPLAIQSSTQRFLYLKITGMPLNRER